MLVTIIGLGEIGRAWARLSARHGHRLHIVDPHAPPKDEIAQQLDLAVDQFEVSAGLDALTSQPDFMLEAAPEKRDVKQTLFSQATHHFGPRTVYASSSSAIPISEIVGRHDFSNHALVAHPLNPPDIIPMVEICPGPATAPWACDAIAAYLQSLGRVPVVMKSEVFGFIANRLQHALFREAAHLVGQGIVTAADIDTVVRDGLAIRWIAEGPCRTLHLNRNASFRSYFEDVKDHLNEISEALCRTPNHPEAGLWAIVDEEDWSLPPEQIRANKHKRDAFMTAFLDWCDARSRTGDTATGSGEKV